MTDPHMPDRPEAAQPSPPPAVDTAPPLAPAPEQSPWWSAPSGKPFSIPDFAHEMRALFMRLFGPAQRQPIPVRIRSRRR
ncbi:hypothetical protein [Pseudorhodoplanes sp.]|uniref:hypothetical protein n=1 Tax=Pseudorhodoplanes sp. TaxID=1934341 RepID=UPI0039199F9B